MKNSIFIKSITLVSFFSLMSVFIAFKIGEFDSIIYTRNQSLLTSSNGGIAEIEEKIRLVNFLQEKVQNDPQKIKEFRTYYQSYYSNKHKQINDSLERIQNVEFYFKNNLKLHDTVIKKIKSLSILNDIGGIELYNLTEKYELQLEKYKYDRIQKKSLDNLFNIEEIDRCLFLLEKIEDKEKLLAMSSKTIISVDKKMIRKYKIRTVEIDTVRKTLIYENYRYKLNDSCYVLFAKSNLPYYLTYYIEDDLKIKLLERKAEILKSK